MGFCNDVFNGNSNFRNDVIDLLNKYIFDNCSSQLLSRYKVMEKYYKNFSYYMVNPNKFEKGYTLGSKRNQLQLQSTFSPHNTWSSYYNLGHDLPIWINAKDDTKMFGKIQDCFITYTNHLNCKTVMLISMDPLRNFNLNNIISLSSPWGIHNPNYAISNYIPSLIYQFISSLNSIGCNVYMTDRNKLYATQTPTTSHGKKATKVTFSSNQKNAMINCLCDEIDIVNPDVIIFIGNLNSAKNCKKKLCRTCVCNAGIQYLHIPHPAAYGSWKTNNTITII